MKRTVLFLFLIAFTYNVTAQEKYPTFSQVKNLSSLSSSNSESPLIQNLSKINSKSSLTSLSLNKKRDPNAARPKDFNFSIAPYFWAMAVGGTLSGPDNQYYTFNKSFSDAIKQLKMAAMIYGKFKYRRVSFLYDIGYINLKRFGATPPEGLGILNANITAKQLLADLTLSYLFPSKSKSTMIDVYLGTRMLELDNEATITISDTATGASRMNMTAYKNTWLSPLLGINSEFLIDPKWFAYARGDIGGFGVNHQMTWQLAGGGGYNISSYFFTTLGIKWVGFNFYKTDYKWTVNDYGIVVSLGYKY